MNVLHLKSDMTFFPSFDFVRFLSFPPISLFPNRSFSLVCFSSFEIFFFLSLSFSLSLYLSLSDYSLSFSLFLSLARSFSLSLILSLSFSPLLSFFSFSFSFNFFNFQFYQSSVKYEIFFDSNFVKI